MAHLFDKVLNKTRSKTPYEVVAKLVHALEKLTDSSSEKLQEDIAKYLSLLKVGFAVPFGCVPQGAKQQKVKPQACAGGDFWGWRGRSK